MRDFRKFCRPKIKTHQDIGDVLAKLKCGTIGAMSPEEYKKVLKFFKLDSFVGESSSSAGKVIATNKITGNTAVFDVETYNLVKDLFEILEIVGEKLIYDPTNGQDYVDLGLPSGTKWATMNVGASSETGYGLFFQWGDTQGYTAAQVGSGEGKKYFGWEDYKYSNNGGSSASDMTKYNSTDGLVTLQASDDAAVANMGGSWRMPTDTEFTELLNNTNTQWTTIDGVSGYKFTHKNDSSKYVFFPAAGLCYYGSVYYVGSFGYYWSSSLDTSSVIFGRYLYFLSSNCVMDFNNRFFGFSVRGVLDDSNAQIPDNPAQEGDIICYNSELDRQAIFSYSDWLNLDDSWDAIGLYGIETFDNDDEVTEDRYVIMANGTTFIIKTTDYSKVSNEFEVVDIIYNNDYSNNYLTIVSLQDNNTIGLRAINANLLKTISVSTDNGTTWTTKESSTSGTTLATLNTGDKLLIKGSNAVYSNSSYVNYFTSTANFNVEGNIMSLCYDDNFAGQTALDSAGYNFNSLFCVCSKLISAEHLILPATTLTTNCYQNMFFNCTALTTAPKILPATTLATYCYYYMFKGCTSLITAPELPATTLASNCCQYMFQNCTALIVAPELPATTLAEYCYNGMFNNCTSLTTAPSILPATTLATYCYYYMFNGCISLTTAPELPATTLATGCYNGMFEHCSSLTTAPELPATTLASSCYSYMFYDCTSLNYIKCLATDISASNCTADWVYNIAATGTFIKADGMNNWTNGNGGIPSGWTVQDAS